jgi:hypothetical protein
MKFLFQIIVALLASNVALAQSNYLPAEIRKRFPDESVVFLERSSTITFSLEGDSLKAHTDISEDLFHLKNQTDNYTNRRVYGSSFMKVDKLKAKTLVWEKNKYKEVPVSGWTKSSSADDNIFYDDSYYYTCNYPSVAADNRTQLEYREIYKDIRLMTGFIFTTYAPQVKSKFVIKAPRGVEFFFEVRNDPAGMVKLQKSEKGNVITYEWTAENVRPMKFEEKSPSIRYYEPHLVCYVKSYQTKTRTIDVLPDLKALHTWYRSFVKDVDEPPHPALQTVVSELKEKHKTEEAVAREIFYWVQDNIQYI